MAKLLNEVSKADLLAAAISKSLSAAPLTVEELTSLRNLSFGDLIIEHNLDYSQAKKVATWRRLEASRLQDELITFRIGEPVKQPFLGGTCYPGLLEALGMTSKKKIM